ncbi:DUF317 domain-containing protein [Streptomyces sp. NPDC093252]|uniref:DUF317 domain-containing protein n=1 Tax=Streptomyces sp. NPDC093252 TaxID=3154980 RepID=UPI0034301E71
MPLPSYQLSGNPDGPGSPYPVYWVSPRHLAGDDDSLCQAVGDTLTALGWNMWPTARDTLLYLSPDGLHGVEWILAAHPFVLGGLRVAWQLSARSHTASAMTEWNAYFTPGTPQEALADLITATATLAGDVVRTVPDSVLVALTAQGWMRDLDHPSTTASDPGFSTSVSLGAVPALIQDSDPRPGPLGWQAWAEPVVGDPYLWCASFSPSAPHALVAAFATSLASPVPVPRRRLPEGTEGRLTVVRRT